MRSHPLFEKLRIFAPGPTPVPQEVLGELAKPPLHHRTDQFSEIFARTKKRLQMLFQTEQPAYLLSSSGTGALETAVVNLFSPGDRVLVIEGGKFGQRWKKLAQRFGLETDVIEVEWGRPVDPAAVADALKKNPGTKGVFFQASETSTAVYHPVKELADVIRKESDALVIVDAITALGVCELPMDQWGLDVVTGGAQKALMLPPGIAFLALSEKAHARRKEATLPRFYFDLDAEDKAATSGQSAWTPAVGLICGLDRVLERVESTGLDNLFSFYAGLAEATRRGGQSMGLELFAESPSPAVTAFKVPDGIEGKAIVGGLRKDFGITIAGGQDHLKGKIFRIGHLGFYDQLDVLTVLSALEMTLKGLGHSLEMGAGVGAAAQSFLDNR